MMKTIVLIGTAHPYQTLSTCSQLEHTQAFQRYLLDVCPQYDIKTVAEELSEEAMMGNKEKLENNKKWLESQNPEVWPLDWERMQEDLKRYKAILENCKEGMSIPQRLEKELPVKHRFCDPDRKQRNSLGIFQENDIKSEALPRTLSEDEINRKVIESHRKREKFWLERLLEIPESDWPVLFICGADHAERFSELLDENGFEVKCIKEDWEPAISTEYESRQQRTKGRSSIVRAFSLKFGPNP